MLLCTAPRFPQPPHPEWPRLFWLQARMRVEVSGIALKMWPRLRITSPQRIKYCSRASTTRNPPCPIARLQECSLHAILSSAKKVADCTYLTNRALQLWVSSQTKSPRLAINRLKRRRLDRRVVTRRVVTSQIPPFSTCAVEAHTTQTSSCGATSRPLRKISPATQLVDHN